jgi:hypothetical protein
LRARVLASAAARSSARPRWRPLVALTGGAIFARWAWTNVGHGPSRDGAAVLLVIVLPLVVAVAMTLGSVTGRRGMLGPPLARLAAILAGGLLAAVALAFAAGALPPGPAHAADTPHADLPAALGALLGARALGAPRDPNHPALGAAAIGASVGAWISVACGASCGATATWHVLVHHVTFVPALAAAAAVGVALRDRRRGRDVRGWPV